jgi:hypothetical protein
MPDSSSRVQVFLPSNRESRTRALSEPRPKKEAMWSSDPSVRGSTATRRLRCGASSALHRKPSRGMLAAF